MTQSTRSKTCIDYSDMSLDPTTFLLMGYRLILEIHDNRITPENFKRLNLQDMDAIGRAQVHLHTDFRWK